MGDVRIAIQGDYRTGRVHHMYGTGNGDCRVIMGIRVVETDYVSSRHIDVHFTGDSRHAIPIHNVGPIRSRIHIGISGLVGDIGIPTQGD